MSDTKTKVELDIITEPGYEPTPEEKAKAEQARQISGQIYDLFLMNKINPADALFILTSLVGSIVISTAKVGSIVPVMERIQNRIFQTVVCGVLKNKPEHLVEMLKAGRDEAAKEDPSFAKKGDGLISALEGAFGMKPEPKLSDLEQKELEAATRNVNPATMKLN